MLITAGGLSLDKKKWLETSGNYLMPEKGLKKRWRFNVISEIIKANNKNLLTMPFLPKKEEHLNLRGVISVISKLSWYIFIGTRLAEVGISVKYIGRYTRRPVIAETRILKCTDKWAVFKYKDYAQGGENRVKTMRLFTFITYLTQHIPEKYFRIVRGYGLFSNRNKGKMLEIVRKILKRKKKKLNQMTWRERMKKLTGNDPLVCDKCKCEMELIFYCYGFNGDAIKRFKLQIGERVPIEQYSL